MRRTLGSSSTQIYSMNSINGQRFSRGNFGPRFRFNPTVLVPRIRLAGCNIISRFQDHETLSRPSYYGATTRNYYCTAVPAPTKRNTTNAFVKCIRGDGDSPAVIIVVERRKISRRIRWRARFSGTFRFGDSRRAFEIRRTTTGEVLFFYSYAPGGIYYCLVGWTKRARKRKTGVRRSCPIDYTDFGW